jgi:hypothetical protein
MVSYTLANSDGLLRRVGYVLGSGVVMLGSVGAVVASVYQWVWRAAKCADRRL